MAKEASEKTAPLGAASSSDDLQQAVGEVHPSGGPPLGRDSPNGRRSSESQAEAFDYWERRLVAASWAAVRPGWKEGFDAMAAADPGVVLGVAVKRSTGG